MEQQKPDMKIQCLNCPEGFYFAAFKKIWVVDKEDMEQIAQNYIQLCFDDARANKGDNKLYLLNKTTIGGRTFKGPNQQEFENRFLMSALWAMRHVWEPYEPDQEALKKWREEMIAKYGAPQPEQAQPKAPKKGAPGPGPKKKKKP